MNNAIVNGFETAAPTALGLPATLRYYLRSSCADNTRRTYKAQWEHFAAWCAQRGSEALPAAPEIVAEYLAERARAGAAVASINVMLAAVRFAHTLAGLTFQHESPVLALAMKGIRRQNLGPQRQAEPLTGDLLRTVLSRPTKAIEDLRDGALLATLYAFGLRASEAAALDWQGVGQGRGWLSLREDRAEVVLLGSKLSCATCIEQPL